MGGVPPGITVCLARECLQASAGVNIGRRISNEETLNLWFFIKDRHHRRRRDLQCALI